MIDPVQDALDDWSLLQTITERLSVAETMESVLQGLMLAAPAATECEACLWTIDGEADGPSPSWTLAGLLPAVGRAASAGLGERRSPSQLPLADLCLGDPGVPVAICSVDEDARLDAPTRDPWRARGVASALVLALPLRDRSVGLLTIEWARQVALGPREQRMYRALSRHAALLLD